jgi:protocatechuate 3,4-dioxygenase beta subunit
MCLKRRGTEPKDDFSRKGAPFHVQSRFPTVTTKQNISRRRLLFGSAGLLLAGCERSSVKGYTARSAPTPTPSSPPPSSHAPFVAPASMSTPNTSVCDLTADNIEGPFFKALAPERRALVEQATLGHRLMLSATIRDTDCRRVPGAIVELWQADHTGAYDNSGFGFRAALRSDEHGRFSVRTIIPGRYLNGERYRPAHIHFKLSKPGFAPLTTQLYFPNDPYNVGDPFIVSSLIMKLTDATYEHGSYGAYDFVLARV